MSKDQCSKDVECLLRRSIGHWSLNIASFPPAIPHRVGQFVHQQSVKTELAGGFDEFIEAHRLADVTGGAELVADDDVPMFLRGDEHEDAEQPGPAGLCGWFFKPCGETD